MSFINIPLSVPPHSIPILGVMTSLSLSLSTPGEDFQKEVPSPRTSCPMGYKAYRSHCYALVMTPKSWFQADVSGKGWG